jgi:hypothetical protein
MIKSSPSFGIHKLHCDLPSPVGEAGQLGALHRYQIHRAGQDPDSCPSCASDFCKHFTRPARLVDDGRIVPRTSDSTCARNFAFESRRAAVLFSVNDSIPRASEKGNALSC